MAQFLFPQPEISQDSFSPIGGRIWAPEALESAWYPAGPMDRIPKSRMRLIRMQQNLMEDAFVHLDKLEIRVSAYTKRFSPKATAVALAAYLRKARRLKTLNLGVTSTEGREDYRRHVRGKGAPADAFIDVLRHITVGVRWPALKTLWLSMAMTTSSLITLLSNVAQHLDDLRLTECILIGRGDSWDQTYDFMRNLKMRALQKLRFRQCVDLTPDGLGPREARNYWCTSAHPFPSKSVLHFSLAKSGPVLHGYSSVLYDYILNKVDEKGPGYATAVRKPDRGDLSNQSSSLDVDGWEDYWYPDEDLSDSSDMVDNLDSGIDSGSDGL